MTISRPFHCFLNSKLDCGLISTHILNSKALRNEASLLIKARSNIKISVLKTTLKLVYRSFRKQM